MKFEDKLKLFKAGTHVFNTPTKETYDKLMVELEKRGYMWGSRDEPTKYDMYSGNATYISYEPYMEIRACYTTDFDVAEVLTLTIEDFEEPAEITSVTIIGNSSNSIGYLKVYTRAKVTKGSSGYTIEILPPPKFTIGDLFVISSGKLGKVIGIPEYVNGKYTYEIQWTDGRNNKCQPEDSMIKLEESFK